MPGACDRRTGLVAALCLLSVTGCQTTKPLTIGPLVRWEATQLSPTDLAAELAKDPLRSGTDLTGHELFRTEHASYHLVQIQGREHPHLHRASDLTVMVVQGEGLLYVATDAMPVQPGSVVVIPRGVIHHYSHRSKEPAIIYAIYTPPLQPGDIEPLPP